MLSYREMVINSTSYLSLSCSHREEIKSMCVCTCVRVCMCVGQRSALPLYNFLPYFLRQGLSPSLELVNWLGCLTSGQRALGILLTLPSLPCAGVTGSAVTADFLHGCSGPRMCRVDTVYRATSLALTLISKSRLETPHWFLNCLSS